MAIERVIEILVSCDHYDPSDGRCPNGGHDRWDRIVDAVYELRGEGWTIGKKTLCPDHVRGSSGG